MHTCFNAFMGIKTLVLLITADYLPLRCGIQRVTESLFAIDC